MRTSAVSERAALAIGDALSGKKLGRLATMLLFAGPAVVASIAYMDPGNFATNIQAGAAYGYSLLWVVLLANLVAMLFQALSAKLGIVTGRNLAEHCRDQFPPGVVLAMWVLSELAAMATDLAEFIGGSIGFCAAVPCPALGRHGRRRAGHARNSHHSATRLPAAGAGDRRARGGDRPLLPRRDVRRAGGLARGGVRRRHAVAAGRASAHHRGWDHRRDGDAARALLAFGADAVPASPARRPRAGHAVALLQSRGAAGARRRRAGEHGDGGDGRFGVPRRPPRGRRDRDRLSLADAAAGRGGGDVVSDLAAGVRDFQLRWSARWRGRSSCRGSRGARSRSGCGER